VGLLRKFAVHLTVYRKGVDNYLGGRTTEVIARRHESSPFAFFSNEGVNFFRTKQRQRDLLTVTHIPITKIHIHCVSMKLSIALGTILSSQTFPLFSEAKLSTWSPHDKQQWREEKTKDGDQRVAVTSLATTRTLPLGGPRPSQQRQDQISQRSHLWSQQRMRMRKKLMEKSNELVNPKFNGSRKTESIFCDPSSSDPDVGVLTCGEGKLCVPSKTSSLGGKCQKVTDGVVVYRDSEEQPEGADGNIPKSVECIPFVFSNGAADVGVLGCGVNEVCIESMASGLGGFCTTSVTDRRLDSEFYWYV